MGGGSCLLVSLKVRWHWIGLGEGRGWGEVGAVLHVKGFSHYEDQSMRFGKLESTCRHCMEWMIRESAQKIHLILKAFVDSVALLGRSSHVHAAQKSHPSSY